MWCKHAECDTSSGSTESLSGSRDRQRLCVIREDDLAVVHCLRDDARQHRYEEVCSVESCDAERKSWVDHCELRMFQGGKSSGEWQGTPVKFPETRDLLALFSLEAAFLQQILGIPGGVGPLAAGAVTVS